MEFTHTIITRFNVNIHPNPYNFRLSETWLTERFELFSKFCLPSVRAQECQDFTWLVLFDAKTPERFMRFIRFFEKYKNFRPLFCNEFATILPQVREYLACMEPDAAAYLTTRLDNDDALSKKFVAVLHKVVENLPSAQEEPSSELYINFPNGLQYHHGDVYDFRDVTNAFVSLLEQNKPPQTVFWVDHPDIYKKAPVAQIETKPIFLQNVHGMNVYNYIRGTVSQDPAVLSDFPLNL